MRCGLVAARHCQDRSTGIEDFDRFDHRGHNGIGLHVARHLAEQGLTALVGARDAARGAETAAQVGGRPVVLDVTDPDTIAAAAAAIPEPDVLVNNAGISLDTGASVIETDVEIFRRTYETSVFGVVAVTNAMLPALSRSAHPRIITVSSGTGSLGWSTEPNPKFDFQAAGVLRLALLPDDGSTGQLFCYDGTVARR
ncbi:SDR family NAD(P)-dependent oxidoreductase [Rathayibacter soli]|uniref:SDR family NAD(P)-dependent oxidoreductase n=1 Tax=Rathayibacter soli TaxID=3144168 RepID=UPI0027E4188D|nr:SDR family NAD(P)-dependent oxidoreductase [Glaciibacter superstes]